MERDNGRRCRHCGRLRSPAAARIETEREAAERRRSFKQPKRRQEHAARGVEAARLKAEGLTWAQVADRLKFVSPSAASRAAERHGRPEDIGRWTR